MAYTPGYTKKNFVNGQAPSINAANLNAIETTLVNLETNAQTYSAKVDTLESGLSSETSARQTADNNLWTAVSKRATTDSLNAEITTRRNDVATINSNITELSAKAEATQRSLDALWWVEKGKTWDRQSVSSDAYTDTVGSGCRVADVQKLGGKSVVWNQLVAESSHTFSNTSTDTRTSLQLYFNGTILVSSAPIGINRYFYTPTSDGYCYLKHNGSATDITIYYNYNAKIYANHKYIITMNVLGNNPTTVGGISIQNLVIADLTQMYGSDAPTTLTDERIKAIESYASSHSAYNSGELISAKVTSVQSKSKYKSVDMGTLNWAIGTIGSYGQFFRLVGTINGRKITNNILCSKYTTMSASGVLTTDKSIVGDYTYFDNNGIVIHDSAYSDVASFKASLSGIMLYYEPISTDDADTIEEVTVPTSLTSIDLRSAGSCYDYFDFVPKKYSNMKSVDLGSLTWSRYTDGAIPYFRTQRPSNSVRNSNLFCDKYSYVEFSTLYSGGTNLVMTYYEDYILITDTQYGSASAFKSAMNGTILYYEATSGGEDKSFMTMHKRIGVVDLGSLTWSYDDFWYTTSGVSSIKRLTLNMLHSIYSATVNPNASMGVNSMKMADSGKLWVNNGSTTTKPSGILYYELATEQVTLIEDDIPYFKCEANGTITYIQQSTELPIPHTTEYTVQLTEVGV